MSAHSSLTAAVVGAGAGGTLSINALIASDHYRLIGVADLSEAARGRVTERTGGSVETFASHQDLFARLRPEVVCVSTYAPTHLSITEAALDIPGLRGMLVEKPLGDSTAAGAKIIELLRQRELPIAVPHGLMALAAPRQIVHEVREGAIGALRLVEIECRNWDIINAGIHWLQFFVTLTGSAPVETVLAAADTTSRTYRDGMQVETEAITMARCANGVRAVLNIGDHVPIRRDDTICLFRIVGDDGLIEYGAWEGSYIRAVSGRDREVVTPEPWPVTGHQLHLETLAEQIVGGSRDYSIAESSLQALEIVEASYLSNRIGAAVTLPIGEFVPPQPTDWDPGRAYAGVGGGRNGREL